MQPANILFVGGDPYASQVPIRFLISCGFEVVVAGSGAEAWSLVEAGNVRFDVIIADHNTPRAGGLGCLGLVTKLHSVRYSAATIILADNPWLAELAVYKTLGVKWILKKPVELWELQRSVEGAQPA